MKRSSFILVAAIIPILFGSVMMFAPEMMIANTLTVEISTGIHAVTQWVGFGVFTVGIINFLSRNDNGSTALKAVMVGNILFHGLGLCFDVYDYSIGIMRLAGLITGLVPHSVLALGFIYYLWKMPAEKSS
jgi:hypothetical protein